MIYILLLFCLLQSTAKEILNDHSLHPKEWRQPWFCHDVECRPYVVVNKTDTFEKRCYPAALWWMAFKNNIPIGEPNDFAPLYKVIRQYIDGYNVKKIRYNLTVPVLLRIDINKTYISLHSHVWVPPHVLPLLSKPLNPNFHFVETRDYCVYVRSFGGRVHSYNDELKKQVAELKSDLDKAGLDYKRNFVWFAGYDAPWRVYGRHNEVWFRLKHDNEDHMNQV